MSSDPRPRLSDNLADYLIACFGCDHSSGSLQQNEQSDLEADHSYVEESLSLTGIVISLYNGTMADVPTLKPVRWIGSSRRDVGAFPEPVKDHVGYACSWRSGAKHRDSKTLRRFGGAGVGEIITDHFGDTFRTVYTSQYEGVIYVLHAFQKKSKSGRATPKPEIDLIKRRLREAERMAKEKPS